MKIGKTPESKPQRRGSFAEVEKFLDRHGGNSSPLIWSEDTDPTKVEAWRDSGPTASKRKASLKPKTGDYYRRTTSYIDVMGDKSNLVNWKIRKTVVGMLESPQLIDQFNALDDPFGADKGEADKITKRAQEIAGSNDRADAGTAIHSFLEDVDSGEDPGYIPEENEPDIDAYVVETSDLEVLGIELFCVQDEYKVAGTFDRLVAVHGETAERMGLDDGTVVIADLKTGSTVEYDYGKICMQLAGYANMQMYNPATFERSVIHPDLNREKGIVIHLPLGQGLCTLYEADLVKGWWGFKTCDVIHRWRSHWGSTKNKPKPII